MLLLNILGLFPETDVLCVKRLQAFYPWFLFGVLIKDKYGILRDIARRRKAPLTIISLAVVVGCVLIYRFLEGVSVLNFFVTSLMCIAIWCVSLMLSSYYETMNNRVAQEKLFSFFGRYSLQYYLNHLLIMLPCYYVGAAVYGYSQELSLILIYLCALVASTLMLYAEQKMPYVRYLCGL